MAVKRFPLWAIVTTAFRVVQNLDLITRVAAWKWALVSKSSTSENLCYTFQKETRAAFSSCPDMIDAIQEFDIDRGEDVNMRVGVHTGTVLCGIVGTRRFKFDVWSNDVTFANKLESTGQPGRVHISESTAKFLQDTYVLENYEDLQGKNVINLKVTVPSRRGCY